MKPPKQAAAVMDCVFWVLLLFSVFAVMANAPFSLFWLLCDFPGVG